MKTITQLFDQMFTKVSPAAVKSASGQSAAAGRSTRPAPVIEAMEDRVLMSATLGVAVGGGDLLPADDRPMESLSLNYTTIQF